MTTSDKHSYQPDGGIQLEGDILVVDDTPANLRILTSMLQSYGYRVRPAINGQVALTAVASSLPDLILLDIMMPGLDGYEVCRQLKSNPTTRDIPVIFISALDDTLDKVRAFEVGGIDYIAKPFQIEEVMARIVNHLTLYRQRREIARLNEFKDLVLRTVTHDLGNPITNILGYTELLLEQYEIYQTLDLDKALPTLNRIAQTARYMSRLVSRLLNFSHLEGGAELQLDLVSLHEILTRQLIEFELPMEQKRLNLETDLPNTGVLIEGDDHWLDELFNNLLGNAIKYTPVGGTVRVQLEPAPDAVQVRISDTGIGIPPEALPHIFERFYRVEAHRETHMGSGLGLSIVETIVQLHGGKIGVESEVNVGTTFTISLPRHPPHPSS
jgi:two-component system, sensor histidine kinase and response regulator